MFEDNSDSVGTYLRLNSSPKPVLAPEISQTFEGDMISIRLVVKYVFV